MQKVIKQIDCQGYIVTADAMDTQKAAAQAIVKADCGEYCLALKENQKRAYEEIKEYFGCGDFPKGLMEQNRQKPGNRDSCVPCQWTLHLS